MDRTIRQQIREFLDSPKKKKIEIDVPDGFKVRQAVNPFLLAYRKTVLFVQQWIIPCRFKNWLLRTTGMDVGRDVCVPHYIHFDPYFPELIKVDKGSLIGGLSALHTHELKNDKLTLGRIHVKEKVLLAGASTVYPGVTINKYSITGMYSHIRKDVPERSFVVSNDRRVKEWNDEEVEKYFADSTHEKNYYRTFKQKVKTFRKDPEMMRVVIRNGGKRLNPGDEWYLARPWPRIFYNAFFVELARFAPGSWLRKLLVRCMGAKIGKNVYLGKNVVFDHIYGDKTTIEDNVYVGDGCYFDGHSYTIAESIFGRVRIGENTRLERDVMVHCGVTIGKNVTVNGPAVVMKDIPDGETWSGVPAKKVDG